MNRCRRIVLLTVAIVAAFPALLRADDTDPLIGVWKLDVARSKFQSAPGPKGQLRTYRRVGNGEQLVSRGIGADGKPSLVQYTAEYDGKDYAMTGSLGGDRISLTRIDRFTTVSNQKRDGRSAIVATRTVSKDGKTLTVVSKGTTAQGETIDVTMVFDRH